MSHERTLGDLGEDAVLARILPLMPPAARASLGPGDDSAAVAVAGEVLVSADTMVHGPDFRTAWSHPEELGWKAAASNLADVAAMGGRPTALVVSLVAPPETPVAWAEGFARGLAAACAELAPGCGVVGGDLATGPALTVAVTVLGEMAEGLAPVTRSGAVAGAVLAHAGDLGFAAAGLELLFREAVGPPSEAGPGEPDARLAERLRDVHPRLLSAQLAPRPPIAAGAVAAAAGAIALLDVSDGLVTDARRLARASRVSFELDPVAIDAAAARLGDAYGAARPSPEHLRRLVLQGAEDHGLLAVFPGEVPAGFAPIGSCVENEYSSASVESDEEASPQVRIDGRPMAIEGWDPYRGWDGSAG